MIWSLLGQFFDATIGQVVDSLGGHPRSIDRNTLGEGAPRRDRPLLPPVRYVGGSASPFPAPTWDSSTAATARQESESDKNLDDDAIKLVQYAIVSLRPCRERILPGGSGEVLVKGRKSSENFVVWIIACYMQECAPQNEIPREDKKYLRVFYQVLNRWPREPLCCVDTRKLDALKGIENAIRKLRLRPPSPPPPPPRASAPLERTVEPAMAALRGGVPIAEPTPVPEAGAPTPSVPTPVEETVAPPSEAPVAVSETETAPAGAVTSQEAEASRPKIEAGPGETPAPETPPSPPPETTSVTALPLPEEAPAGEKAAERSSESVAPSPAPEAPAAAPATRKRRPTRPRTESAEDRGASEEPTPPKSRPGRRPSGPTRRRP